MINELIASLPAWVATYVPVASYAWLIFMWPAAMYISAGARVVVLMLLLTPLAGALIPALFILVIVSGLLFDELLFGLV